MANFQFRLDTLRRLRESERDQRRQAVADALQAEQTLREQAEELRRELSRSREDSREEARPGKINIDRVVQTHRHQAVLRGQIQMLEDKIAKVAEEVERRRALLVEADRQLRVLEKLRDKKLREHVAGELRREVNSLDETAIQQWSNRTRSGR